MKKRCDNDFVTNEVYNALKKVVIAYCKKRGMPLVAHDDMVSTAMEHVALAIKTRAFLFCNSQKARMKFLTTAAIFGVKNQICRNIGATGCKIALANADVTKTNTLADYSKVSAENMIIAEEHIADVMSKCADVRIRNIIYDKLVNGFTVNEIAKINRITRKTVYIVCKTGIEEIRKHYGADAEEQNKRIKEAAAKLSSCETEKKP